MPYLGIAQSEQQDKPILWLKGNGRPYNPFRDGNFYNKSQQQVPASRSFFNIIPAKKDKQNQDSQVVVKKKNIVKEKRIALGLNFAKFIGDFESVGDFESRRNTQFSLEYVREKLRGRKGWATLTGFAIQGMGGRFTSNEPSSSEETKYRLWYLEFMPIGVSKRFKTDFGSPMVFLGYKIRGLIGGSFLNSSSSERRKISIGFEEKDFEPTFIPIDQAFSLGFAWQYENYFASIEGNFGTVPINTGLILPDLTNTFVGIRLGYVFQRKK
jgi:hypothetical protein